MSSPRVVNFSQDRCRPRRLLRQLVVTLLALAMSGVRDVRAEDSTGPVSHPGYDILRSKAFLPPDFDQQTFEQLWKRWPAEERAAAEKASPEERRRMTLTHYGIIPKPAADKRPGLALGYLDDGQGRWVMTCLVCHGGKVAGRVIPGLPNTHYMLQTLTEDVRATKLQLGKPLSHMDLGSLRMNLGGSPGTTNAVVFGLALGSLRDKDMQVVLNGPRPKLIDHDLDVPPFWNVRKKKRLYCDAFAPKNHRVLMQFVLLPQTSRATLESWEGEFRSIQEWIESTEAPEYPWPVDRKLADAGRVVFETHCSRCHGRYGETETYPNRVVPLKTIGTDPVRFQALSVEHRRWLKEGWLSRYGRDEVILEPKGYLAPPLDGVWASAPYFHNGAVPTLWHVLHPAERPHVWRRTEDGYDRERVGLEVTTFESVPAEAETPRQRRRFFDTGVRGKSAGGHKFPDKLNDDEKRAVLEYLKSL